MALAGCKMLNKFHPLHSIALLQQTFQKHSCSNKNSPTHTVRYYFTKGHSSTTSLTSLINKQKQITKRYSSDIASIFGEASDDDYTDEDKPKTKQQEKM